MSFFVFICDDDIIIKKEINYEFEDFIKRIFLSYIKCDKITLVKESLYVF